MTLPRMPVLFVGHGSPMNAIEDNEFSQAWIKIGKKLPKPKAILSISAHWETRGTSITGAHKPITIHDFSGFPKQLVQITYPAEGSTWLVDQVNGALNNVNLLVDQNWGLDHGTWSVLRSMYPKADIPVVQLSLNRSYDSEYHYLLGNRLLSLREEGVLIFGSGNLVHNLREVDYQDIAFDWAVKYDAMVKEWILNGNHEAVIHHEKHGESAELAVNTAEHYLPLLYVLGASEPGEPVKFFCEKVTLGSISMRCVQIG